MPLRLYSICWYCGNAKKESVSKLCTQCENKPRAHNFMQHAKAPFVRPQAALQKVGPILQQALQAKTDVRPPARQEKNVAVQEKIVARVVMDRDDVIQVVRAELQAELAKVQESIDKLAQAVRAQSVQVVTPGLQQDGKHRGYTHQENVQAVKLAIIDTMAANPAAAWTGNTLGEAIYRAHPEFASPRGKKKFVQRVWWYMRQMVKDGMIEPLQVTPRRSVYRLAAKKA